jgi:hypothetical protein
MSAVTLPVLLATNKQPTTPSRPPAPSLPTELKQQIIGEALAGLGPKERQQTRHAVGRLSRGWRRAVTFWEEVEVIGIKQVAGLNALFGQAESMAGAAERVESVYIEVVRQEGLAKAKQVASLLRRLSNLQSVTIVTGKSYLSSEWSTDSLGPVVAEALWALPRVARFALNSLIVGTCSPPVITPVLLKTSGSSPCRSTLCL